MMKVRLSFCIAVAGLFSLLFPAAGLAVGTGAIAGSVEDASDHTALEEIKACAYRVNDFGGGSACDLTDADGEYSIEELVAGSYKVEFTLPYGSGANYITQYFSGKSSWEKADLVSVSEGGTTTSVDAAMQPGGQISGEVVDAAGKTGLESIRVCTRLPNEPGGLECAETNAEGEYTISGLETGSYSVRFSPGFGELSPGVYGSLNYITQYYDGKSTEAAADPVAVVAGSEESGIDAEMVEGGQITGTVLAAAGKAPLQSVEVCPYAAGKTELPGSCSYTDSSGEYTISGLASGSYKVKFSPSGFEPQYASQYYDGKATLAAADAVAVSAGATESSIDAELVELGKISGKVKAAGGGGLSGFTVCAVASNFQVSRCTGTDSAGDYTITGLPAGSYRVAFKGGLEYVTQYHAGASAELDATLVDVSLATTTPGVDAELQKAAKIGGKVADAASKAALAGIEVCPLKPNGTVFWTSAGCASTNASGEYTIGGLPAGTYKVRFAPVGPFGPNYLVEYYNGHSTAGAGDAIVVGAGALVSAIDAELHPGGKIAGRVTAADTMLPLNGLSVCAFRARSSGFTNCALTNTAGEYKIPRLVGGSYKVRVSPGVESANYLRQFYSDKPTKKLSDPVSVTVGATTGNVDFTLRPGGRIAGTVTGADGGDPVAGVEACARRPADSSQFICDQTDSAGGYTIEGLPAGSYVVRFQPAYGYHLNYLGQYYDGKAGEGEANQVQVTAGATASGIDAELAAGGRITGTVIDAVSKDPAPPVRACAAAVDDYEYDVCGVTNPSGEYAINGLASGAYKVRFSPGLETGMGSEILPNYNYATTYYDGAATESEADPVSVTAGSTTSGIDAEMAEGGKISGKLIDAESKAPIRYGNACAYTADDLEFVECAGTGAAGEYILEGLSAGDYRVRFSSFGGPEGGGNYLARYYADSATPAGADPVTVTAGAETTDVDGELHLGGQIEGRVTETAEGTSLPHVFVCALETTGEEEPLACAETDLEGRYTVSGLPSGSYKVKFSAFDYEEGAEEEEFVTQFYPGAANAALAGPVAVTVGAVTASIDAQMVETGSAPGPGPGPGGNPGSAGGSPPVSAVQIPGPSVPSVKPPGRKPGKPAKPIKCKKGFKKKKVRAKTRCVKVKRRH